MAVPRGIRNNNPGNLILTSIPWQGKVPVSQNTDTGTPRMEQFTSMAYGVRAMLKDISGDITNHGLNTIRKLMYQYCPPPDDTEGYIKYIVDKTGIPENKTISPDRTTLVAIGQVITGVENGWSNMLPESTISEGYDLMSGTIQKAKEVVKRNPKKTIFFSAVALGLLCWGGYELEKRNR